MIYAAFMCAHFAATGRELCERMYPFTVATIEECEAELASFRRSQPKYETTFTAADGDVITRWVECRQHAADWAPIN